MYTNNGFQKFKNECITIKQFIKNYFEMKRMEICQMAHENAQRKGFWDIRKSNEHYLMLICTEIAELVEADRKSKTAENN